MLNYKHLNYVLEVAHSGSIAEAARRLNLQPQTISGQINSFETLLGVDLFEKQGRQLVLTEAGEVAVQYAEQIFQSGQALVDHLKQYRSNVNPRFRIGIADVVPKSLVYRLLKPLFEMQNLRLQIICQEGQLDELITQLTQQKMDVVIADRPTPAHFNVKTQDQRLGSSAVSFYATSKLMNNIKGEFPALLNNAPILMPTQGAAILEKLKQWFFEEDIIPQILGEFDDSALMKAFSLANSGIFIAPSALAGNLAEEGLHKLGQVASVTENYHIIYPDRKWQHPGIEVIVAGAASWLK